MFWHAKKIFYGNGHARVKRLPMPGLAVVSIIYLTPSQDVNGGKGDFFPEERSPRQGQRLSWESGEAV